MDHFIGVDLGSHIDYSAVSLLTRALAIDPRTRMPRRDSRGEPVVEWRLRAIRRFALRTPYTEIADKIARIALMPGLRPSPRVVVDGTGIGAAVLELIHTALREHPGVEIWSVSITAGENWRVVRRRELNCSKTQLIGALAAVLHSGRLRVSRKPDGKPIDGADLLEKELASFKARQSRRSDAEILGATGADHDDAVLSLSLPIWAGSLPFMRMDTTIAADIVPDFQARELAALSAEERAEREALRLEMEALEDERRHPHRPRFEEGAADALTNLLTEENWL